MWKMQNFAYQSLTSKLLHLLYPSYCPLCKNPSDLFSYSPICSPCWAQIKRYTGPSCKICAIPFPSEHANICGHCMKKKPVFSKCITYGIYEGALAEAIHQFKFYGLKRLARPLGSLLLNIDLPQTEGIIPVPLSIKGLRNRGFNQSLLLARIIARDMKSPLLMDVLSKKKETLPQIGLSSKERLSNLKGSFEVRENIDGLRLLLVDDVITTGATVTECSKELLRAGAEEVVVLALARASLN
jgi:competence protein ComFC